VLGVPRYPFSLLLPHDHDDPASVFFLVRSHRSFSTSSTPASSTAPAPPITRPRLRQCHRRLAAPSHCQPATGPPPPPATSSTNASDGSLQSPTLTSVPLSPSVLIRHPAWRRRPHRHRPHRPQLHHRLRSAAAPLDSPLRRSENNWAGQHWSRAKPQQVFGP
jgi:hypothetical protein